MCVWPRSSSLQLPPRRLPARTEWYHPSVRMQTESTFEMQTIHKRTAVCSKACLLWISTWSWYSCHAPVCGTGWILWIPSLPDTAYMQPQITSWLKSFCRRDASRLIYYLQQSWIQGRIQTCELIILWLKRQEGFQQIQFSKYFQLVTQVSQCALGDQLKNGGRYHHRIYKPAGMWMLVERAEKLQN